MTDKQPEALRLADELMDGMSDEHWNQLSADAATLLRTQHAEIQRKDALLRQALEAMAHGCPPDCKDGLTDSGGTYPWGEAALIRCPTCETLESITQELSQ